ncbi:MAG: hypothetical protein ACPG5B_01785 [Chitinophagales bacterium]
MSEISIKKLKSEFDVLRLHKKKIDPQNIINLQIFDNFEQKYHKTVQNSDFLPKKLKNLQNELQALSTYLGHFSIFLGLYEQFLEQEKIAEKDVAFYQASSFINLTLESFTKGKDVEIGVIEQIELLRNAITNLRKKPTKLENALDKNEKLPLFNNFKASNAKINAFVAEKKIYKNPLSPAKFAKLKNAYDILKQDMMQYLIKREAYRYRFFMQYFCDALQSNDVPKMQVFLNRAKKEIATTCIEMPKNGAILEEKLVNISGRSEANTYVLLTINNEQKIKTEVDKNGIFHLENIELSFDENVITYENESFGFIEDKPHYLTFQLKKTYLFLGRYDPLTQKAFEVEELNDIVRCESCRNFLYNFSVAENEGNCMIKSCEGKSFYSSKDAQFWVK